jgi:hypothetical protein
VFTRMFRGVSWQVNTDALNVNSAFIVVPRRRAVSEPLSSNLEGAQCPYRHVLKVCSTFVFMLGRSALPVPLSSCLEGAHCQYLYFQA